MLEYVNQHYPWILIAIFVAGLFAKPVFEHAVVPLFKYIVGTCFEFALEAEDSVNGDNSILSRLARAEKLRGYIESSNSRLEKDIKRLAMAMDESYSPKKIALEGKHGVNSWGMYDPKDTEKIEAERKAGAFHNPLKDEL